MSTRLGILATHPVQYHAPWFRHLSNCLDVTVYYARRDTPESQSRAGFGVEFEWDTPLLEGYDHRWLESVRACQSSGFRRFDTPQIANILRDEPFDAFLIFGWNHKSAWQTLRACNASRVPTLMRGDSQLRTPRGRLLRALKRISYAHLLSRFSAHLYVGRRNREYLRHYGVPDANLFHVPHFVDVDAFANRSTHARNSGASAAVRRRFGIPDEASVFLFAGKLIDKKRPADFLEAIERLSSHEGRDSVHALVVGDGPLRPRLELEYATCNGNVHFAGFVNQSEMPTYYACADALVLPSDGRETWGLVVNEAAACGVPAVVSEDAGCVEDLIDDDCTGFRFETGCIEDLKSAMIRLRRAANSKRAEMTRALAALSRRHSLDAATVGLLRALAKIRHLAPSRAET